MTTRLIQRHLFQGTREFELVDDHVNVRIKAPFRKEEVLTVMLTVLDPEPVIGRSCVNFNSRVNGEALISLFPGKPSTEEFNAFVSVLKERAQEEFRAFAGLRSSAPRAGLGGNVYEEPPEFDDLDPDQMGRAVQDLDPVRLEESIQMLKTYLDPKDTETFVLALEALKDDPTNERLLVEAVNAFHGLGSSQGAVLTYAPYVSVVVSDGPLRW
jgi:hypothetical protein